MILVDSQIKELCIRPSYFSCVGDPVIPGVTHPQTVVDGMLKLSSGMLIEATDEVIERQGWKPMIEPFCPSLVREMEGGVKAISFGTSSMGYDIRLSNKDLKVFTNINSAIVDPRKMDPSAYTTPRLQYDEEDGAEFFLLPPGTGVNGHTPEYFRMPPDVIGICTGKSTYARALVAVIVSPLEPDWEGNLVVEIINHTSSPVRIYTNMGISQINFFRGNKRPDVTYADRGGKYQGQRFTQDPTV